jgi:DNA-nicking Smr family endonuclease
MSGDDVRRRRRHLTDDERALWRHVTRSVAPLRRRMRAAEADEAAANAPSSKPPPAKRTAKAPAPKPAPAPKRPPPLAPLERRAKQKLARGQEPIEARLDLHGRTQSEAYMALLGFLRRAQDDGCKFVLVITGKGARAAADGGFGERGVLRRLVPQWLALPEFRACVVGYEEAHAAHGGAGAIYVRVRRGRA